MRWSALLLFGFGPLLVAQQPTTTQLPQPARVAAATILEIKLNAGWYHPDLGPLNEGYTAVEQALGQRTWGDSRVPYLVSVEVRYPLLPDHFVVAEFAGAITGRTHEDDRSWVSLWRGGAGYRWQTLPNPLHLSLQATGGLIGLHVSRSYNDKSRFLNAVETSWYIAGSASVTYDILSRTALEFTAGYVFTPQLSTTTPSAAFDLSAPVIGFGVMISIP